MSQMPGDHPRSRGPILRPQDRLPRPPSPQERQLASQQNRAANKRKAREAIFKETGVRIGGVRLEEEDESVHGVFADAVVINERQAEVTVVVELSDADSHGEQDDLTLGEVVVVPPLASNIVEVQHGDVAVEGSAVPPNQAARKPFFQRVVDLFHRWFRRH